MNQDDARRAALDALLETAFLLEREHADTYRVRAFRRAAGIVAGLSASDLTSRLANGTFRDLPGIGPVADKLVTEAARGQSPSYLTDLRATPPPDPGAGSALFASLQGDLHSHSDWSDGGSPIEQMAATAQALGHAYLALTDHSPRLTVANGLSRERLEAQLDVVDAVNAATGGGFRLLTGIEVDILDDGRLDQDDELLARLDVVVASVHSKLRMPAAQMTQRMVAAVQHPAVSVLGHCTGRMTTGTGERRRVRPPSEFDADQVFTACADNGVAVEVNSRPERRDPPRPLIRLAAGLGCRFSIDSDAHAPGQLAWLPYGSRRAAEEGLTQEQVVNSRPLDELLSWLHRHR